MGRDNNARGGRLKLVIRAPPRAEVSHDSTWTGRRELCKTTARETLNQACILRTTGLFEPHTYILLYIRYRLSRRQVGLKHYLDTSTLLVHATIFHKSSVDSSDQYVLWSFSFDDFERFYCCASTCQLQITTRNPQCV